MESANKYLKLEVIWKDDDMFELRVIASNGRYSGMTEVYKVDEPLLKFAKDLNGFPNGQKELIHSCGKKDSYAFFEMRLYQIDPYGKVGVLIIMEENVATDYRPEEKDKLKLELIVEPSAIDNFQRQLEHLAQTESGTAELIGI